VALSAIHKIVGKRRGSELIAITVDEGIKGYRDESISFATNLCRDMGIRHETLSFRSTFGFEMDSISKRNLLPCSYCGVFRRHCLNISAKKLEADVLATGLNLDDTAQSIFMNLARADVGKLARLGPHNVVQEGLVPRIQPLRDIPEKEVYLYAILNDIDIHNSQCPHSERAMRLKFKSLIGELEDEMPGTRHSILKAYDAIRPSLLKEYPRIELNECANCREPTAGRFCKACELVSTLEKDS
jgi:uncharacterized protein (TIGR00269 family)